METYCVTAALLHAEICIVSTTATGVSKSKKQQLI
jgi:hypothetical protein